MKGNVLGIDVSKRKFDVALQREDGKSRSRAFSNDEAGFQRLQEWLQRLGVERVHACLEATGTYGLALAEYLHGEGHVVSVVNPAQIKAFGNSELQRTKTDRVDAKLIARFCRAMAPSPWQPPAPEVAQLQALVRRLESLQQMIQQERNRLEAPGLSPAVQESLERTLELLEAELQRLQDQIRSHLDQHPGLKELA